MKAVVVSFDHLHLGFLGCYGNSWIETPHLDRLATEAAVFDQHFGENFDPEAREHAWWTGCYQSRQTRSEQPAQRSLLTRMREAGVPARLLIDAASRLPAVERHFQHVQRISGDQRPEAAEQDTSMARVLEAARREVPGLALRSTPELLWVHLRGVDVGWQPPEFYASLYEADEEAIEPLEEQEPASGDEQYGPSTEELRRLYAGGVSMLDRHVGELLEAIDEFPREELLLIVAAAAGAPFGVERSSSREVGILYEELIHAPLLIRLPSGAAAGERTRALVQTVDLAPTLLDWFGVPPSPQPWTGQSLLPLLRGETFDRAAAYVALPPNEWGIRTERFYYRCTFHPESAGREPVAAELFVRPADRWDVDDRSREYAEELSEFEGRLREFAAPVLAPR